MLNMPNLCSSAYVPTFHILYKCLSAEVSLLYMWRSGLGPHKCVYTVIKLAWSACTFAHVSFLFLQSKKLCVLSSWTNGVSLKLIRRPCKQVSRGFLQAETWPAWPALQWNRWTMENRLPGICTNIYKWVFSGIFSLAFSWFHIMNAFPPQSQSYQAVCNQRPVEV